MLDGFHGEIHIQVGPVQVAGMRELDIQQFCDGNVPEPRKLLERQEELTSVEEQPESMLRDIRDFNF
jgi:hypothetical protein